MNENYRGIPGTELVVWHDVFRALDEIGYDGWGVMESFVPKVLEVASLTTTWRMVAPSVDAILEGGLRFFREVHETANRLTVETSTTNGEDAASVVQCLPPSDCPSSISLRSRSSL